MRSVVGSVIAVLFVAADALPDDAPGSPRAPNLARQSPPAAQVSYDHAIRTGVEWLVKNQKPDGSWGKRSSGRMWEVMASVPGGHYAFEAATTAIAWMGLNDAPYQPEASKQAQARALQWLVENVRVKRARGGELYNTWSFGFGLQALAQALKKKAPGAEEVELRATAAELVKAIGIYQTPDGGLGYYDFRSRTYRPSWSTSFTTATGLIALHHAEQAGVDVPAALVSKSKDHILRCRTPTGSYLYGSYMKYYPHAGINKPQGSSMRTQTCNLALRFAGAKITDRDLQKGLEELLIKHHRFAIAGVRRPIPHESWYAVSGYFYLYGHMYAALVLEQLPETQRKYFSPKLIEAVLKTRQPDGSFWDYPLYGYHKPYGTGFALMALSRCTPPRKHQKK